jgi:hypothetical protein
MSPMSRKLTWVLLGVLAIVVVVVVFFSRGSESKRRTKDDDTVTAPVTRPPRQWTATTASEQAPPPDCAPVADGGFSCGACRDDSSCPAGQSCFVDMQSGRTECQGSECTKNDECPQGMLCRVVARTSRGEPWRSCVSPGIRSAGAACEPDNAGDPSVSCSRNLLCVQGGCAPACVENEFPERNACAGEVPCLKTDEGWGCVPSCKHTAKSSCGDGKVCEYLSVEDQTALCVHKVGSNCLGSKGGCAYGSDCIVETNAREERATFSCAPRCNPGDPKSRCAADSVCVPGKTSGHCRHRCVPLADKACPVGERCIRLAGQANVGFCSAT